VQERQGGKGTEGHSEDGAKKTGVPRGRSPLLADFVPVCLCPFDAFLSTLV
jgi:hypothetical protein